MVFFIFTFFSLSTPNSHTKSLCFWLYYIFIYSILAFSVFFLPSNKLPAGRRDQHNCRLPPSLLLTAEFLPQTGQLIKTRATNQNFALTSSPTCFLGTLKTTTVVCYLFLPVPISPLN